MTSTAHGVRTNGFLKSQINEAWFPKDLFHLRNLFLVCIDSFWCMVAISWSFVASVFQIKVIWETSHICLIPLCDYLWKTCLIFLIQIVGPFPSTVAVSMPKQNVDPFTLTYEEKIFISSLISAYVYRSSMENISIMQSSVKFNMF